MIIQCKRYNAVLVTEPDINQFLGAMNKFQANYGVLSQIVVSLIVQE